MRRAAIVAPFRTPSARSVDRCDTVGSPTGDGGHPRGHTAVRCRSRCDPAPWSGPVPAVHKLFKRTGLTFDDMARVEINEAFAVQVLAVLKAWDWNEDEKLNVCGSVSRWATHRGHRHAHPDHHVARTMPQDSGLGLETMCIGGGQGLAQLSRRPRPCANSAWRAVLSRPTVAAIQHVALWRLSAGSRAVASVMTDTLIRSYRRRRTGSRSVPAYPRIHARIEAANSYGSAAAYPHRRQGAR